MESVNVEHLLQNYKVADIIQIQRKLRVDVEKKKTDLKALIGERYNELLEATESIGKMKSSVAQLIDSLKSLNGVLSNDNQMIVVDKEQNTNDRILQPELATMYTSALITKRLFDLPLQIWNSLQKGDVIMATYKYFYGMHQYSRLQLDDVLGQRSNKANEMHYYNRLAITDLSGYIIDHCWHCIGVQSAGQEVDHSQFADYAICILLLQETNCKTVGNEIDTSRLIEEFFTRQTRNLSNCFVQLPDGSLSTLLETLLNIIMNTVKCCTVFHGDTTGVYEPLLVQRYRRMINLTYDCHDQYTIALDLQSSQTQLQMLTEQSSSKNSSIIQKHIHTWITSSLATDVWPILEARLKKITTIVDIFTELDCAERRTVATTRFTEWEEYYIELLDVKRHIWTDCIQRIIQNRVYEVAQERIDLIVTQLEEQFSSHQAELHHSWPTANIVEFVWKDPTTASNDQFMALVSSCCSTVTQGFSLLFDDISAVREQPDKQEYLSMINDKIYNFFVEVKRRIDCTLADCAQSVLFGAVLFDRLLTQACTPVKAIIDDLQPISDNQSITWTTVERHIKQLSDDYFCVWFRHIVVEHFAPLDASIFTDLQQFMHCLTRWERVSIAEAVQQEDKTSDSMTTSTSIEAPVQISLVIFQVLQTICMDINRYCAYNAPRSVRISILCLIAHHLVPLYQVALEQLESSSYPVSAKQVISLQLYFDLLFLKQLFSMPKHEPLRTGPVGVIGTILKRLESLIDPFDLHIIFPALQQNSARLFTSSCSITFGFLFTSTSSSVNTKITESLPTKQKPLQQSEVKHNIMLAHRCECQFTSQSSSSLSMSSIAIASPGASSQ